MALLTKELLTLGSTHYGDRLPMATDSLWLQTHYGYTAKT